MNTSNCFRESKYIEGLLLLTTIEGEEEENILFKHRQLTEIVWLIFAQT